MKRFSIFLLLLAFMGYKTALATIETPFSEGGKWMQQDPDQTKCAVTSVGGVHVLHGTQTGSGAFDDSQAYYPGIVGDNHTVICKVFRVAGLSNSSPIDEVEILLRCSDTGSSGSMVGHCYEMNVGHSGGFANIGSFKGSALISIGNGGAGSIGFIPADNDIFAASIYTKANGDVVITGYWNGVQFIQATDSSVGKIMTGAPGVGFFINVSSSGNDRFGFREVALSNIVMVGTANHGVTNAGSCAVTYSGAMANSLLVTAVSILQGSTTAQAAITPTDTNGSWADAGSPALSVDTPNGVRFGVMQARQESCNGGNHTVTYTFPNGATYAEMSVTEYLGIATSSALDKTASGTGTTSPITVGPTAALAQNEEVALAAVMAFAGTGSGSTGLSDPPSGYIKLHVQQDDNLTVAAEHGFQIIVDGIAPSAVWAWTDGGVNDAAALIATYMVAAAASAFVPDEEGEWIWTVQQP